MGDETTTRVRGSDFTTMVSELLRVAPEADLGGEVNQLKPPSGDYVGTAA
ncbi:MAG TPA: hypothetical protein VKB29_10755 [Candidatus Binataceae bacterium]|nr:hypothetical protein [Candidatus Binataceae bacterium]